MRGGGGETDRQIEVGERGVVIWMCECLQAMGELVSKGLVKAIGISNFTITKTERLLQTAKIVPAVNQVECHPYFQQKKLKHYCDKRGSLLFITMHIVILA